MNTEKIECINLNDDCLNNPPIDVYRDKIMDRLCLRLSETERSKEFLSNVPYEDVGNGLALSMDIYVSDISEDQDRVVVSKSLIQELDMDENEAFSLAKNNAPIINLPILVALTPAGINSDSENLLNRPEPLQAAEAEGMFVLTTKGSYLGACALFYPEIKERVADIMGSGYYILPSSIHEVILLSDRIYKDEKFMCELVTNANRDVVDAEDVLSDNVFHYYKDTHNIEIVRINKQ